MKIKTFAISMSLVFIIAFALAGCTSIEGFTLDQESSVNLTAELPPQQTPDRIVTGKVEAIDQFADLAEIYFNCRLSIIVPVSSFDKWNQANMLNNVWTYSLKETDRHVPNGKIYLIIDISPEIRSIYSGGR